MTTIGFIAGGNPALISDIRLVRLPAAPWLADLLAAKRLKSPSIAAIRLKTRAVD